MAETSSAEDQAFTTVSALRPATKNHNLKLKVLDSKIVVNRPKGPNGGAKKIAECIVGDETGCIVFSAHNEQAELAQPGAYLTVSNAKVDMWRGSMRLAVDGAGRVERDEGGAFTPKKDLNMSEIEFELVYV